MVYRTIQDIYTCPHCGSITAEGDYFCRGCGIQFSKNDVQIMETNIHPLMGSSPWNIRDRYRCLHCDKFISISDPYCRGCGDEIENHEKQLMSLKLKELAKQNLSALLGLGAFVLVVIMLSSIAVK